MYIKRGAGHESPLVVFIDEIEGFLRLPMHVADDFLSALRTLDNDRGREPSFRRLWFCLMGVCTPCALIRDHLRSQRAGDHISVGVHRRDTEDQSTAARLDPLLLHPLHC